MSKNKMLAFYFSNARRLCNREAIVPVSTVSEEKMFTFFLPSVRRMSDYETIRPIEQLVAKNRACTVFERAKDV